MARKTLSDRGVAALKPRAARYALPDPQLIGHYIRVTPTGVKTFVAVTSHAGRQTWHTIGAADAVPIAEAREKARLALKRMREGLPPVEIKGETFGDVAANWVRRHVEPQALRSKREIIRLLDSHILPAWRDREFVGIKRSDVAALLDKVEDNHGARAADYVLNVVRSIANWFAARNDDYTPPIVRGMRRQNPHAQARARILTDEEVRAIWQAAESSGPFGGIIRLALLTAQRRTKIATMRWSDISIDGEWTIPRLPREKDTAGSLILPDVALAIIRAQPRLGDNPFVFAGRGNGHFNGLGKAKARLDSNLPGTPSWVLHDLRRSARSLLSRAGVRPDISERVLGHAIVGIEKVYDRHSYRDEKADALKRLATLIETIISPPAGNVVALKPRKRKARADA